MTKGMAQTMAAKRQDLERALSPVTSELLREKGYICFVDVLMKLGYLSPSDYENWRFKRVPYLERVITLNLSTIHFLMKTVRRPSRTDAVVQNAQTLYRIDSPNRYVRPVSACRISEIGWPSLSNEVYEVSNPLVFG